MELLGKWWRTYRGWPGWVQVVVAVLVVAVIAGSAASGGNKKATSTGSNVSAPTVSGFGATTAAWNAAHTADPHYATGAAYNPDPALPASVGDDYAAVQHEEGRVLGYFYNFKNKPIAAARADVLRTQFPRDAKVAWFVTKRTCAQMMVTSATLGYALGSKTIGDPHGAALVEFSSGKADNSYSPGAVNQALFSLTELLPASKAPGC